MPAKSGAGRHPLQPSEHPTCPEAKPLTLSVLREKVHYQLKAQKITVLHFDEAQDIWGNANKPRRRAVINTLKSLAQNKK